MEHADKEELNPFNGNSIAVNGRKDIGALYGRALINVGLFVEDAANI